ncbi:MAG: hypothetical protein WEA35_01355 [Candidatus Nanopelagicales bacterium]
MIRRWACAAVIAALVATAAPGLASAAPAPSWYQRGIDMAPRLQWNANSGYCGETSFISAGMRYGQYTSQWTARSLASPGVPQWKASSQLLLGGNDLRAAKAMRLSAVTFDSRTQRSTQEYLRWIKGRFLRGHVVIMGVFNNVTTLGETPPGDAQYDHIVPVMGIGSQSPLRRDGVRYHRSDAITISDNGLYNVGPTYPYLFSYRFSDLPMTRSEANRPGGALYSLRPTPPNYATAVTGIVDDEGVTIPVRLTSDANSEGTWNVTVGKQPPAPTAITLTAHVSIPDDGVAYNVYLYDDFADVPTRGFNAAADRAVQTWQILAGSRSTWRVTINAMSDETRVFRAVPVTAP